MKTNGPVYGGSVCVLAEHVCHRGTSKNLTFSVEVENETGRMVLHRAT